MHEKNKRESLVEKETLVWRPSEKITDKQLDEYLNEATSKRSYNIEQSLAMLNWCKYDVNRAMNEIYKYVPKPDEWTQEDKILFEQAYWYNGKNFNKIRQVVSHGCYSSVN